MMVYSLLAHAVLVIHGAFILFAVSGGALLLWQRTPRWMVCVHLGAALWASFVMFSGRVCPLTPLENYLRQSGGGVGYSGGFIEHYLLSVIYPAGLTRTTQIGLGCAVLVINVVIYCVVLWRWRSKQRTA
jgi:Protein of Unknown function (DUF2784)